MSAVSTLYSFSKTNLSVTNFVIIATRFRRERESRWLGYYKKKMFTPLFDRRKEHYRRTVLRPLEVIPTLEERLKELNAPDPVIDKRVDIGFSRATNKTVSIQDRLKWRKELLALKTAYSNENEIRKIDLHDVKKDWFETDGPPCLRNVADHYGIFSHLYETGYFNPCVHLSILYDYDDESVSPVHMGNILQASDVSKVPNVSFKSKPDDLWTLVLTNLDGHLLDTNSEYLHWFIGNIRGGDVKSGEVVCDYLQPFPMRGTGYHRLVFILYKQNKKIDYSKMKKNIPCMSLEERTFKTYDFYKEHQDFMTPAGLAFFQCTWDESLTDFFHNVLNMQEPIFEYITKPYFTPPQVRDPHYKPFNIYLDRYRDPKEMAKEVLVQRLKSVHPFQEEAPPPKYPCLHRPERLQHSWQREDIRQERLRIGKYRGLRPHSVYPQEDSHFDLGHKT